MSTWRWDGGLADMASDMASTSEQADGERVPFLDLRAAYLELKADVDDAVAGVLDSGRYILGPAVEQFEGSFASYCQAAHAVGVGSGLDALYLSLSAMGVGPGDEVAVPAHTFIATWLAVSRCGATPVPVGPVDGGYNMDPARFSEVITRRTKVVVPVHMYGHPVDLDPIVAIARDKGVRVLEDAAQAHGARYKGTRIGAHGDAVAWSFYPGKNLGALGDGGAVTSDDGQLAQRVRLLRNYGSRQKYVHEIRGINSRLDPIQAAVLQVKLRHLDAWNDRRRAIAEHYLSELSEAGLGLPRPAPWADPVWHLFVVRHPERNAFRARLLERGVETQVHYPTAPADQGAYGGTGSPPACARTARLGRELLSLPIGPHLTRTQVDAVIAAVLAAA